MNRRGFLGVILAAGLAPAVVKAEWLMPSRVLVPTYSEWAAGMAADGYSGRGPLLVTGRTTFAELTNAQKLIWSKEVWGRAREGVILTRFLNGG